MGKRGPKPKALTSTKWCPGLAYAVGLIASDGHLSSSGRHIIFTSKDWQLVDEYKKCLGREVTISKKASTKDGPKIYYHVQFSDVNFYRWLESIGITRDKTRTMSIVKIPTDLFAHFLRGVWDGDGSIYSYQDSRWKSSFMFYTTFSSASRNFLVWLKKEIQKRLSCGGSIVNGERTLILRFAKDDTRKIQKLMFPNNGVPHLHRKLAKAQEILTIDRSFKQNHLSETKQNAQVAKLVDASA